MKINAIITKAVCAAALFATASCNSLIYDYEGDCDPHYKARFVFDMNLHWADAFPHEVNAVTLYLIDPATGDIVWQKSESGEALKTGEYMMDLDVDPGQYRLMAWCGEGVGEDFIVPDADHHTGLTCTLKRDWIDGGPAAAEIRRDIKRLYHGAIRDEQGNLATQTFPDDEGTYIYTIPLIKDTNDVNIVLQHLSGKTIDKDDFTFTITDCNGSMDWDNSLLDDEMLTYYAHHKSAGTAGIGGGDSNPEGRAITSVSACVAEHTVARLVKGQDMRVKIYNKRGETSVDIPLIDYALMVKSAHYADISDQEFLDRQDKYDMVFFLDEDGNWQTAHIYILSWKIVIQNTDL